MNLTQYAKGANVRCNGQSHIPGKVFFEESGKVALVFFQPEDGKFGKWSDEKTAYVVSRLVGNWVGMSDVKFKFAWQKETGGLRFRLLGSNDYCVFSEGYLLKLKGLRRRHLSKYLKNKRKSN